MRLPSWTKYRRTSTRLLAASWQPEGLPIPGHPRRSRPPIYFIGRETVVRREDGKGLPRLVEGTFSFLLRNSSEAIEYLRLPRDLVVEIGHQFAI